VTAIAKHLLPDNAAIAPDGQMRIGGRMLSGVAAEFGTPVFVYDEEHLRTR
jgi:diaminopimelate decarboxylase